MKFILSLVLLGCSMLTAHTQFHKEIDIDQPFEPLNQIAQSASLGIRLFQKRTLLKRDAVFKATTRVGLNGSSNGTCIFNSTGLVLKCFGLQMFECPTEAVIDSIRITTFSAFAISANPIGDLKKTELLKFSLFPRKSDNSGWKHSKIRDSVKQIHEYALFTTPDFSLKGLRVRDVECWKKVINYLSNSRTIESIKLGTSPGRVDDAKIAAKIYIDKMI